MNIQKVLGFFQIPWNMGEVGNTNPVPSYISPKLSLYDPIYNQKSKTPKNLSLGQANYALLVVRKQNCLA